MKEVKLEKWNATVPNGDTVQESIVTVLSLVISVSDSLPTGMVGFRLMRRLAEAFDESETTGTLKLEESDYATLKSVVEKSIPARLARNPKIFAEVEKFLSL